jgi:hypothetical protein
MTVYGALLKVYFLIFSGDTVSPPQS